MTDPGIPGDSSSNTYAIARALLDGTATTRSLVDRIHDISERTFVAPLDATLASDESVHFRVANPGGSDRSSSFYFGELTHGADVSVVLHTDVSGLTGSTPVPIHNNHIGSDVESVMTAETVTDYTSADEHFSQPYLGSGTETVFDGYRITLPPGESFVLEVANLGGNNEVGARFAWAESELLSGGD